MSRKRYNRRYILNEHGQPVPEPDLLTWGLWFEEHANRIVAQEWVENVKISTVFLGLDHNWFGKEPVLWETMTFSNNASFNHEVSCRCGGNREQAEAMHRTVVEQVREQLAKK